MAYVCHGQTELLKEIFSRGKVNPEGIHALEETKRLQRKKRKILEDIISKC